MLEMNFRMTDQGRVLRNQLRGTPPNRRTPHSGPTVVKPSDLAVGKMVGLLFTLDEMVQAAVEASPRRSAASVRRGVLHNATRRSDGSWIWRYDLPSDGNQNTDRVIDGLWDDLESLQMPVMLVIGAESGFVTVADREEVRRRLPSVRLETVAEAGHAIQSDQPDRLVKLIGDFLTIAGTP
jgi:pimeloyl-ACP methyl ester carboxylesterase